MKNTTVYSGKISSGGFIGPRVYFTRPGQRTIVADRGFTDIILYEVRADAISAEGGYMSISYRKVGKVRFLRANPIYAHTHVPAPPKIMDSTGISQVIENLRAINYRDGMLMPIDDCDIASVAVRLAKASMCRDNHISWEDATKYINSVKDEASE
jgi:hypothetical protein